MSTLEEDELLVVDKECVHHKFDRLNKLDSIGLDQEKSIQIGKGLSGIRIFLLITWHMLKIDEKEKNSYFVILDRNVYAGIPNAIAYISQFIKRLREFNEIKGSFEVTFASAANITGAINGTINESNPLSSNEFNTTIYVSENENPFEIVHNEIFTSKNKEIWKEWQRGKKNTEKPSPSQKTATTANKIKETNTTEKIVLDTISSEKKAENLKIKKAKLEARKKELDNMYPHSSEGNQFVKKLKNDYISLRSQYYLDDDYDVNDKDVVVDVSYAHDLDDLIISYVNTYNNVTNNKDIRPKIVIEMVNELKFVLNRLKLCYISEFYSSYERKYNSCIDVEGMFAEFNEVIKKCKKAENDLITEKNDIQKELQEIDFALTHKIDLIDVQMHRLYIDACNGMKSAKTAQEYKKIAETFKKCENYKDSAEKADKCLTLSKYLKTIETAETAYKKAKETVTTLEAEHLKIIKNLPVAENTLENIEKTIANKESSAPARKEEIQKEYNKKTSIIEEKIKQEKNITSEKMQYKNELIVKLNKTSKIFFWKISNLKKAIYETEKEIEHSEEQVTSFEKQTKNLQKDTQKKTDDIDKEIETLNKEYCNLQETIKQSQEKIKNIEENLDKHKKMLKKKNAF